jgi:hypothetical protein
LESNSEVSVEGGAVGVDQPHVIFHEVGHFEDFIFARALGLFSPAPALPKHVTSRQSLKRKGRRPKPTPARRMPSTLA